MWLSRKLSSILSTKHHYHHHYTRKLSAHKISFVLALTSSSATNADNFIRLLGIEPILDHDLSRKLYRLKNNSQFIVQIIEYHDGILPTNYELLDGVFICYDTHNRHYMDDLPDIIDTYLSHHIPSLLIGLSKQNKKSDPQLGNLISNLFGIQSIEINQTIDSIQLLQKCFIQFIYSDRKLYPPSAIQKKTVKRAVPTNQETISSILDQVLDRHQDESILTIFLIVYRKFMKPRQLLELLIERFESEPYTKLYKHEITPRQDRIRSLFCTWLSHFWGDFHNSVTRRILTEFVHHLSISYPSIHASLYPLVLQDPILDKDQLWGLCDEAESQTRKKDSGYCESFQEYWTPVNSNALFGGDMMTIVEQPQIDPFQITSTALASSIAHQLTFVEAELFRKIQPRDLLRHVHYKATDVVLSSSIQHFNFVSAWISSLIVNEPVLEKRVQVFEYCLQIAVELRNLNNFNSLMSVLAGINSAPVLRLKLTKDRMRAKNKKLYDKFLELENLMSSERSFCNYRSALKQTPAPGIPYLGVHQQDLLSLVEGNKDHKGDGQIHWKKFYLMGESVLQVMRFQDPTYEAIEPIPVLLNFIGHHIELSTEDERYEKSKQIEPKLKASLSSSTTNSAISSRWKK